MWMEIVLLAILFILPVLVMLVQIVRVERDVEDTMDAIEVNLRKEKEREWQEYIRQTVESGEFEWIDIKEPADNSNTFRP